MRRLLVSVFTAVVAVLSLAPGEALASTALGQTSGTSTGDCFYASGPYTEVQASDGGTPSYAVPAGGGVITSWSHQSGTNESGTLKLKIYRPTMTANVFTVVGQSAPADLHANTLDGGATRIPVQAGDLLGYTRSTGAVMSCLFSTASLSDVVRDAPGTDTADSMPTTFSTSGGDLRLNMAAVLEPDADHDGYGDETQDQCPTDPNTQGPCPITTTPPTGQRAAAIKHCKKKFPKGKKRKRCLRKAKLLPV